MTERRACIHCSFCLFCNTILCFTLVFFIVWFTFLPQEPKFSITNASLTEFKFTDTNSTLHYNLALDITIRNPNKKADIYYSDIQVVANYRKKRFCMVTLNAVPFYQSHKNTTILDVVLEGQQLEVFGEQELSQFETETAARIYSIDVLFNLRVKIGYDMFKTRYYQLSEGKIDCKLKVPMSGNKTSSRHFKTTKCGNV